MAEARGTLSQPVREGRSRLGAEGGHPHLRGLCHAAVLSAWKLLESPLDVAGMTQLPEIANAR